MKPFSTFLNEDVKQAKWHDRTWNMMKKEYPDMIPLSNKMLERVLKKRFLVTVFHKTNYSGFENLVKYRSTAKAISAASFLFRRDDWNSSIFRGVHRSGFVCRVVGDLLAYQERDIMSQPDSNGRRWVTAKNFGMDWSAASMIQKTCDERTSEINLKPFANHIKEKDYKSFRALVYYTDSLVEMIAYQDPLVVSITIQSVRKLQADLIGLYYRVCEDVIKVYLETVEESKLNLSRAKLAFPKNRETLRNQLAEWSADWDEAVVNRYKILSPVFVEWRPDTNDRTVANFPNAKALEKHLTSKYPGIEFIVFDTHNDIGGSYSGEKVLDYIKTNHPDILKNTNWIKEVPVTA